MNETLKRWLFDPTFGRIVASIIGIGVVMALVRVLSKSVGSYVQDNDARYRVRKFIVFAGYFAAAIVLTTIYSSRLSGLTVVFGVVGAGVAFALQEVIVSIAGWVALTFSRFYSPGDRIELAGVKGDVIDIGILRTTMMEVGDWVNGDLYNGRIVRIANSFIFKSPVFNYSGDFPFLWDEIRVPIRYGSDRKLARSILADVTQEIVGEYTIGARKSWEVMLRTYRLESARVEPMITLIANDNWLEFTVRYVVDYRRRRTTKDDLYTRLLDKLDATEGRVALASATFELVAAPVIRTQMEAENAPPQSSS